ncbi:MAG: hypothetical protein PHP74_01100 [Candidatus Gracilibacteria bacterium]|nr:hypothetical protein [Candidatus Gracilibacteria bacterium]
MKTIKKLKSIFLGLILATTFLLNGSTNSAIAEFTDIKIYSPERPSIPYVEGGIGLSYPSFNNFINNPNLGSAHSNGDERYFTVGKYCTNSDCDGWYSNTPTTNGTNTHYFKEGETVRFRVYFHNNGEDSYDGGTNGSPDAGKTGDVQVGIELNDIQDSTYENVLRPRGFIYADDVYYKDQNGNTIKKINATVRKITDDTQIALGSLGLMLEPVSGSAKVKFANVNGINGDKIFEIKNQTNITFDTAQPKQSITVTPVFEGNKMYLKMDRLPGCYRYSGFAYFDAVVTKNYCETLTAEKEDTGLQKDNKKLYRLYKENLTFLKTGTTIPFPEDTRYKWISTDTNGRFYESKTATTFKTGSILTKLDKPEIYYTGNGPVTLILTRVSNSGTELTPIPDYLNPNVCQANFTFPGICNSLSLTYNSADNVLAKPELMGPIQTVHKITYSGLTFSDNKIPTGTKIKWTSSDPKGRFYSKTPTFYSPVGTANTYIASNTSAQTIYYTGEGTITVYPVNSAGQDDPNLKTIACTKSITVDPAINYCTKLDSGSVTSEYVQIGSQTVYLHTLKTSGFPTSTSAFLPFTTGIHWTTSNPAGKFYKQESNGTYTSKGNNLITSLAGKTYYSGAFTDVITAKLVKTTESYNSVLTPSTQELAQLNQSVCTATFTIPVEPDGICSNLDVTHKNSDNVLATIDGKTVTVHKFQYNGLYFTNSKHPDPTTLGLKWESNDPNGRFYKYLSGNYVKILDKNSIILAPPATVYYVGDGAVSVHPVNQSWKEDETLNTPECNKSFRTQDIQIDFICQNMQISVSDPDTGNLMGENPTLIQNKIYKITATANFNITPENPQIKYTATKGIYATNDAILQYLLDSNNGGLTIEKATAMNIFPQPALIVNNGTPIYFLPFSNQEGAEAIKMEAVGFEEACNKKLGLAAIPKTTCDLLDVKIFTDYGDKFVGELTQNKIHGITAKAIYTNPPENPQIKYAPSKVILGQKQVLQTLQASGGLTREQAQAQGYLSSTTVPDEAMVYFLTLNDQEGTGAMRISAVNYEVPCTKMLELAAIPEEPTVCESMMISVKDDAGNTITGDLAQSKIYEIRAMATYNKTQPNPQNRFVSTKGLFSPAKIFLLWPAMSGITEAIANDPTHPEYNNLQQMQAPQVIPNGQSIYFLPFADQEGPDAFRVEAVGYEDPCNASRGLLDLPEEPTVCKSMFLRVIDGSGTPVAGDLKQNTIYEVRALAAYNKTQTNAQNRFVPAKGLFSTNPTILNTLIALGGITKFEATNPTHPLYELTQPQVITNGQSIYFLPFADQEGPDAFRVEAVGYEDPCNASRGLLALPEKQIICESIEVTEIVNGTPVIRPAGHNFKPGVYQLRANLTYNPEMEGLVTFSTTQGVFFVGTPINATPEITVPEGRTVFMIIPDNATVITVKAATNDPNKVCIANFDTFVEPPEEEEVCENIDVDVDRDNDSVTYTLENSSDLGDFTGKFEFSSTCNNTEEEFSIEEFEDGIEWTGCNKTHTVYIKAVGDLSGGTNCDKTYEYKKSGGGGGGNNPNPEIEKCIINPYNTSSCRESLTYGYGILNQFYSKATYKVTFYPDGVKEATIIEPETITSNIRNKNFDIKGVAIFYDNKTHCDDGLWITSGSRLEKVNKDLNIKQKAESCSSKYNTNKKNFGEIELEGLKNVDEVTIFYEYKNNAEPDTATCLTLTQRDDCSIKLENTVEFETEDDDGESDKVVVSIPCPAIITRESGDVFFHTPINTSNNLACYKLDSTTGLILRPTPETPQTTVDSGGDPTQTTDPITWASPSHDICKMSLAELKDLKLDENALENFSSSVCSMKAEVATQWKEKFINEAIQTNVTKLTRQITEKQWTNGVYYTKNDHKIDQELKVKAEQNDSIPAARTYIIENADLIINSDITYDDASLTIQNLTNPKSIPSAAFIVINGNIQIDPKVTRLDGVFVAIDTKDGTKGKIQPIDRGDKGESYELLTIRGSLVGNVYDLFMSRKGSGNPFQNEGSIVIKYDQRIILNTPPGLTDLLDIAQLRVAN